MNLLSRHRATETMKQYVFLSLFVFCFLCDDVRPSETSGGNVSDAQIRNYSQLRMNAYVIAGLQDRLGKLKARLSQLVSAPTPRKIYSDLIFRVGRLEGRSIILTCFIKIIICLSCDYF